MSDVVESDVMGVMGVESDVMDVIGVESDVMVLGRML